MAQKDENGNEIDALFDKGKGSEESSGDKGEQGKGAGSNQETPEVVEANGRKYDMSKAEDRKAMVDDYKNLNETHSKQASELGELRKKQDEFSKVLNGKTEEADKKKEFEATERDMQLIDRAVSATNQKIQEQQYEEKKVAAVNQFTQKYGLTTADVQKELDESIKATGVKVPPEQIENWYAASHPEEFRKARQKMIRADHPGTHYTETSRKEGMELPNEEVPQFGKNVQDQALELIGASGAE